MKSKAISWGAKHLWGIYAKANKENIRWSARYLAERMDCEVREVRRRKAELIKNNLIIVVPREGRVDEVTINFELVHLLQEKTPDRMDRGQIGQGREGRTGQGNSKELSLKNPLKGSNEVALSRSYFTDRCKELKGFEPEMAFGKEGKLLKEKLKRFSADQIKDLIDKFFNSKVGEDLGFTLSICLSAPVINQWLAGKLEKPKKPTYRGNPMRKMFGKWQVLVNGEWLEFADSEKEIIFK
jgi:hypothetical protein